VRGQSFTRGGKMNRKVYGNEKFCDLLFQMPRHVEDAFVNSTKRQVGNGMVEISMALDAEGMTYMKKLLAAERKNLA
jgi:hypothetical protein